MRKQQWLGLGLGAVLAATALGLPLRAADEPIDYDGINKIRTQGLVPANSKVMEIAGYLTDVYGPRLTGSPNILKAGEWSVAKMKEWGLENAALEPWPADPGGSNNGFPCGWANEKFYLQAVSPQAFPITGTPSAWSPGTNGLVKGEVLLVTETEEQELRTKYGDGKLKGKWIISGAAREIQAYWTPPSTRYTKEQLDNMENPARTNELGSTPPGGAAAAGGRGGRQAGAPAAAPAAGQPATPAATPAGRGDAPAAPAATTPNPCAGTPPAPGAGPAGGGGGGRGGAAGGGFNRNAWLKTEGALGLLSTPGGNWGHGVYTVGGGTRSADPATLLPQIAITAEHYSRIARLLEKGLAVTIEADIKNTYYPNPPMFNVVGEIRGTDKADELVMLGAHFDSWHASTGATDNAAGSAAMLEAMRILKQSGVRLRRTVRIGLWTGEEQGLIGSRLYVTQRFGGGRGGGRGAGGTPTPPTADHAKFSGYFNIDNGTGSIRGVYLQQNQAVAPIFRTWMEPFRNIGMTHLNVNNTGGTDHGSFDAAGLPGWQFIQDTIEYNSMTHHTNLDSYERLQPEDMRRNATIAAAFAFLAANREERLPRKPATPLPAGGRGGQ